MPTRNISVSPAQAAIYQEAADRGDAYRAEWMARALDAAAGLHHLSEWHHGAPQGPGSALHRWWAPTELPRRSATLTIRVSDSAIGQSRLAAWDSAARAAAMPWGRWAVVVLDAAAGLSKLSEQLDLVCPRAAKRLK